MKAALVIIKKMAMVYTLSLQEKFTKAILQMILVMVKEFLLTITKTRLNKLGIWAKKLKNELYRSLINFFLFANITV